MELSLTAASATDSPVNWRRVGLYFALTMLLTHSGMAVYLLKGGATDTMGASGFGAVFMRWCPGIMALIFQRFVNRQPLRAGLQIYFRPNRWFAAAWLTPVLWFLLTLGLSLLLPGTRYTPDLSGLLEHFPGTSAAELVQARAKVSSVPLPTIGALVLFALVIGPTMSTVAAFGEEVAWRGWVLRELQSLGFWRSMTLAAILQAVWHLPFVYEGFMYAGHPVYGTVALFVWVLPQSFLMTYFRVRAKSVIAPAVFHGTAGGATPITAALFLGGSYYLAGDAGVIGSLAQLPFVAACLVHDRFFAKESILRR